MTGLKPHSGPSTRERVLEVYSRVARAEVQRIGLGGRQARLELAVDQQPPDLLVRHGADQVLDVVPAVAQRAAFLVGLGDLGGEGDDTFEAGLDFAHSRSLSEWGSTGASIVSAWVCSALLGHGRPRVPVGSGGRRAAAGAAGVSASRSPRRRCGASRRPTASWARSWTSTATRRWSRRARSRPTTGGCSPASRPRSRPTRPPTGLVFDYGSALLDGHRADHDAHLVRRLRDEGMVLVGSTKSPEFGILPTTEPRHGGPARNPWDPAHTPGGSSGGAAAAVASGMLPDRPRQRRRRLDPHPRRLLRARRPQAEPRPRVARAGLAATRSSSATASSPAPCSTRPPRWTRCRGYEAGDATWAPPPDVAFSTAVNRDPGTLRIHVVTANPLGAAAARREPRRGGGDGASGWRTSATRSSTSSPTCPATETLPLFLDRVRRQHRARASPTPSCWRAARPGPTTSSRCRG